MGRKRTFINSKDILEYWSREDSYIYKKGGLFRFYFKSNEEFCFCCGDIKQIEKAHIIAVSSGGEDTVENLHLLCKSCHLRTEQITDFPFIGKELYKELIINHPNLRIFREEKMYYLITGLNMTEQKEFKEMLN